MNFVEWQKSYFLAIAVAVTVSVSASASTLSPTGENTFVLDPQGATRREAAEALFSARGISVIWRSEETATERVHDRLSGSIDEIFRTLFRDVNFIAVYREGQDHSPMLNRIIVIGRGQPSRSLEAVAKVLAPTAPQSPDEKLLALEELRRNGLAEDELDRRRANERSWEAGREVALQRQFRATAEAPWRENGSIAENDSAGFPTYFVPPPMMASEYYTASAQALTTQMALRGLVAIQDAVTAASRGK